VLVVIQLLAMFIQNYGVVGDDRLLLFLVRFHPLVKDCKDAFNLVFNDDDVAMQIVESFFKPLDGRGIQGGLLGNNIETDGKIVESLIMRVEALIYRIKTLIHRVEALIYRIKTLIDFNELLTDLVEALVYLNESLINCVETPVML